jgi:hypothetical protein
MLDLPVDITEVATSASGATVSFTATATDDVDGSVPVDCSSASGSLFATGTTQVSCSATDAAGNQASGFFQVKVVYDFGNGSGGGFGEPVRDTELNKLAAGAGVPVKFGLGADYGLNTFAVGYPASNKVDCSTGRTLRDPPYTLTGVRRSCSPSVETRHRWRPHRTGSGGRRGPPQARRAPASRRRRRRWCWSSVSWSWFGRTGPPRSHRSWLGPCRKFMLCLPRTRAARRRCHTRLPTPRASPRLARCWGRCRGRFRRPLATPSAQRC